MIFMSRIPLLFPAFCFSLMLLVSGATGLFADRNDFQIEVQVQEDPWATGEAADADGPMPIRRPRAQPRTETQTENPLDDTRTDYIATIISMQDNMVRARHYPYIYVYIGLAVAVAALIGILISFIYFHRRRQAQARAHAKQYSKKLRRALKTSLKSQRPRSDPPIAQTFTSPTIRLDGNQDESDTLTASPASGKRLDTVDAQS
jgi:hypothetical protein